MDGASVTPRCPIPRSVLALLTPRPSWSVHHSRPHPPLQTFLHVALGRRPVLLLCLPRGPRSSSSPTLTLLVIPSSPLALHPIYALTSTPTSPISAPPLKFKVTYPTAYTVPITSGKEASQNSLNQKQTLASLASHTCSPHGFLIAVNGRASSQLFKPAFPRAAFSVHLHPSTSTVNSPLRLHPQHSHPYCLMLPPWYSITSTTTVTALL